MEEKPILVFQTDFTYKEGAVSAMYGTVKSVDRSLEIFTGSHEIPHFDAWSASYRLWQTVRFWPKGTIFVSVVDPGVGTDRRAAAAKTKDGYIIITPDNGTLTHVADFHGIETVRMIDYKNRRPMSEGSAVFDGRDLFGYNAARLAAGQISFEELGPEYPVDEIVKLPMPKANAEEGFVSGYFEIVDPNFGNMWSNILASDFEHAGFAYGEQLVLKVIHNGETVLEKAMPYERAFGNVKKGEPLLYTNELLHVSAALSEGNMLAEYHLGFGPEWKVEIRRENNG